MKRKKRQSGGGMKVARCGAQKHRIDEDSKVDYDRMHILELCDDLEGYLSASTPEIHVVRLPPVTIVDDGNHLREELSSDAGVSSAAVPLNPEPCEGEASGSSIRTSFTDGCHSPGSGGLGLGLDFILSPLALKEPTGSQNFVEEFEKLLEMKFGIMALRIRHGLDAWLLGSRMVHPFEILSFVAAKPVLSRAYFKMWEMIQMFDLVPTVAKSRRFLSAHLCEGPGGFIEAVREYRAESSIPENSYGKEETFEAKNENYSTRHSTTGIECSPMSDSIYECRPQTTTVLLNGIPEAASRCHTSNTDSPSDTHGLDIHPLSLESSGVPVGCESSPKGVRTPNMVNGAEPKSNFSRGVDHDVSRQNEDNETSTSKSTSVTDQLLNKCSSSIASTNFEGHVESTEGGMSNGVHTSRVHGGNLEGNVEILSRLSSTGDKPWNQKLCRPSPAAAGGGTGGAADNSEPLSLSSEGTATTKKEPYHDLWFGLTLASKQKQRQRAAGGTTPPPMEMSKLNEKVVGNSQGHVHYGVDGSGDVTNPANVSAFVEYILSHSDRQRMDLVTADGAFDVSEDFSSQEHSHLNLVFCEMVAALRIQAKEGSFVLKLFDCYTASTISVLFILSALYRSVKIVRLRTTRICNSERYVVAKGFMGLSPELEEGLVRLNVEWNMAVTRGEKVGLLLSGGLFPNKLLDAVMESNAAISAEQVDGISRALQLANVIGERLPSSLSYGRRKGSVSMLRRKLQTVKRMQRNAIALCEELNIRRKPQFATK